MSQPYGFILHAKTRPEKAEAFEALFRAYVEPSRREDGCIEYHMLRDQADPTLFIFYEIWRWGALWTYTRPCHTCALSTSSAWNSSSAISTSA